MGINIRTNVESLRAQRDLNATSDRLRTAYARLSSGLRITRAADDAAGLAIAEQLKADQRVASVAIRNANDGISIIAITDGAMNEITSSLVRLAELAEQSANGVYDTSQRSALQLEFVAVSSEIQRIADTTQFNGLQLLTQGGSVTFQVGFDGFSNSQITYSGVQATLAAIGLRADNGTSGLTFSINDTTNLGAQEAARSALNAIQAAVGSLTRARGTLGSAESRLNIAIQNLQVARENFAAAESRIRDVDVAFEAAELTRLNILQQAATAVLAQANQQPSLALSLLQ
ncbi:MAG TPA: flagellin [Oligoflexia bacterium]|nr:flagellin [Oligoflexia bacterium]HMP47336.1 flagellin [Oligoflexia bacterium]